MMRTMSRVFLLLLLSASSLAGAAGVRVVQDRGVWWYEDAHGKRFFSLGACCVAGCYGHAERNPLAPERKSRIVGWLKSWGFNTAAAWSSPSVYPEFYVAEQIYTGFNTSYHAKEKREDVFDDRFWNDWIPGAVRNEVAELKRQPTLIGYFVDNEPHWNERAVLDYYLGLKPATPGSRALVAFSRSRYGDRIGNLNAAWGTRLRSFEAIAGLTLPRRAPAGLDGFRRSWRTEVAGVYYARYIALVRAADPDHLILGVRWAGLPDPELYRRVTALCDVSSVNDYNRYGTLRDAYAKYYEASPRPIMITEWSFSGYPEPGHKSLQFIDVGTQERRAEGYRKYVLAASRAPYMIGMHWFLFSDYDKQDEAKGGYPPDENMGLVSHDESKVYDVLTRECARTNAEVEAVHRGALAAAPRLAPNSVAGQAPSLVEGRALSPVEGQAPAAGAGPLPLVRLTPAVDGSLVEWPAAATVTPWVSESLTDGVDAGHRYALAADDRFLYLGADITDARLDDPGAGWRWEGDYLAVYFTPEHRPADGTDGGAAIYLYRTGGGKGGTQPFAAFWEDPVPGAVVLTRTRAGGYVLEAKLPRAAFGGGKPGSWTVGLNYRDAGGIYETWWDARVGLR